MSRERRRFFDFDVVVIWANTYVLLVWANTYVGLYCRDIARLGMLVALTLLPAGATFKDAAAQTMVS
jgi:hypothetical protein